MGIRNLTIILAMGIMCASSAFASAGKHDIILKVCGSIKGNINDYETPEEYKNDAGKTCYKVGCRAETGSRGDDQYDISINYRTRCFSTQEIVDRMFGDDINGDLNGEFDLVLKTDAGNGSTSSNGSTGVNGNIGVNGSINLGDGNGWYISGRAVSESEWRNKCIKKNGKIRNKCTRGMTIYNDAYSDSGNRGVSVGGKYVIVRRSDGSTFNCSYTSTWDHCLGESGAVIVSVHGSSDGCVNCGSNGNKSSSTLSGIAEIAGAILPPLAYLGSNWLWSDAYLGSNQAWAGAAATGFEQCQTMQTNYVNSMYGNGTTDMKGFFSNNELPYQSTTTPNCNGYQLGGMAGGMGYMGTGMGGFGNPWMSAGYSPGMIGGMSGPYGSYNPYGNVNGMNGMNGMGLGLNLGLGMGTGMGTGMYPGMGMGTGMYPGMGMGTGMYPGMGTGMYPGMGIGINGSIGTGYTGGMGYPGYAGGMYGNTGNGSMGMGTVPWGNGNGSYWNGSGGWGTGSSGGNYGNIQQSYALNQQALGMDTYYQQAGLQNSVNQSMQNMYSNGNMYGTGYSGYGNGYYNGNYGNAAYSPMNMGLGLSLGFGLGY